MKKNETNSADPGMLFSIVSMVLIIASIVLSIQAGFGTQMSVFVGAVVTIAISMIKKTRWADIQKISMDNLANCGITIMILILVGILIGIWLIGGTLPTLIYYGLEFISPRAILPLTFILCAITSVFTGTSYGSIATMGLAMYGVGINMGIPAVVMAGAVVSGSFFGDKMSPLSDTTNIAPAVAETDLYAHIGSMFYTTVPASVITLILYTVIGLRYSAQTYDASSISLIQDTLSSAYHINLICMLPLFLVIILAACKVPSILAMGISAVVSVILAVITQGAALSDIMSSALSGYVSETGVDMVDTILTRGGISSMIDTIAVLCFANFMAGGLKASGILNAFEKILLKVVRSTVSLVVSTLVFAWGMVILTSSQMIGIIVPGKAMGGLYDELNVNRKVLSRSLEDSSTIGSTLIPWSGEAIYITSVLGVGLGYIPFSFLCYIVPVFSVICAATGFGIWDSLGEPVWKNHKKKEMQSA